MPDNFRAHGKTFASSQTDGVDIPSVHVDGVTFNGTLDPTNLALEAGNLATIATNTATLKPGAAVHVDFTGTSAQSSAITATVVELSATAACHVLFGSNPTALSSSTYLPANVVVRYAFTSGQKIAAIQHSAGGTLYITPGV